MNTETLRKLIDLDMSQSYPSAKDEISDKNILYSKLRQEDYKKAINLSRMYKPSLKESLGIPSEYTFGLELEFTDADLEKVEEEINSSGMKEWVTKIDETVTDDVEIPLDSEIPALDSDYLSSVDPEIAALMYQNMEYNMPKTNRVTVKHYGGEVNSPVMVDKPELWEQLSKVCQIIEKNGGKVSDECGGHIHVGMAVLDHAPKRWQRFFQIWQCFEDTVLRLSGGKDTNIRKGYEYFAKPVSHMMSDFTDKERIINSPEDIKKLAEDFSRMGNKDKSENRSDMNTSLNITHLSFPANKKPTIEFRSFNASLDPVMWQSNVLVACGITRAAVELSAENENNKHRIELLEKNLRQVRNGEYKYNPEGDTKKFMDFLDIVFTNPKDKLRVFNQWSNTKEVDLSKFYNNNDALAKTASGKDR